MAPGQGRSSPWAEPQDPTPQPGSPWALGSATYILLGAKIWFVPGFNFNQKIFFHVFILQGGKTQSPASKLESNHLTSLRAGGWETSGSPLQEQLTWLGAHNTPGAHSLVQFSSQPVTGLVILSSFYRWGKGSSKVGGDLFKAAETMTELGLKTRFVWL